MEFCTKLNVFALSKIAFPSLYTKTSAVCTVSSSASLILKRGLNVLVKNTETYSDSRSKMGI
jgi:hypothetical protein